MRIKSLNLSAVIIIVTLFATGCTSGMYGGGQQAQPIPTTMSGEDGVIIAVTPSYWPWSPKNLGDYVTPYYIRITNNSAKTIILDYEDIVLFDQFKNQYTPLSPDTVASIFNTSTPTTYQSDYSYPRVSVGVGFGFGGGYGRRYGYGGYRRGYYGPRVGVYGYSPVYYSPPPAAYYSKPVNTSDILTQALPLGPVHPGATITGFLYFRNVTEQASQVTLDIGYNAGGSTKENVLSFPFDLTLRP